MKIFFTLLGAALLGAAVLMGGSIASFINLPSILVVIGGMVCFSLAHHDFSAIQEAIQHALSDAPSPNIQGYCRACDPA